MPFWNKSSWGSHPHTPKLKEYSNLTKEQIQGILNEICQNAKSLEEINSKIGQKINYPGELIVSALPGNASIEFKNTESGDVIFFADTKKNLTPEETLVD